MMLVNLRREGSLAGWKASREEIVRAIVGDQKT
jgi:hypothetical protein